MQLYCIYKTRCFLEDPHPLRFFIQIPHLLFSMLKHSLPAAIFIVLLLGLGLWAFLSNPTLPSTSLSQPGQLKVVVSFYPLAEFTKRVGGDQVTVTNLTPPGTEPHEYEPTAQDIAEIYQKDLFLYNGGGVDLWAEKIASDLQKNGVRSIQMTSEIDGLLPASEEDETFDEHIWLDPIHAIKIAGTIRDAFVEKDPALAELYRGDAKLLIAELQELDLAYRTGLADCTNRVAVTSHAAFGYLAKSYNFEQLPITGISPEDEPSAGDLATLPH